MPLVIRSIRLGQKMPPKSFKIQSIKQKRKLSLKKKILSWDKSHAQSSLDSFYATILTSKHFPNDILDLKILMQKALIFSHGQAHVESRCSIKDTFLSTSSRRVSCKSTQNQRHHQFLWSRSQRSNFKEDVDRHLLALLEPLSASFKGDEEKARGQFFYVKAKKKVIGAEGNLKEAAGH